MERFLAIFHRQDKISSVAQILLLEPFFFFFFKQNFPWYRCSSEHTRKNVGLRLSGNQMRTSADWVRKGRRASSRFCPSSVPRWNALPHARIAYAPGRNGPQHSWWLGHHNLGRIQEAVSFPMVSQRGSREDCNICYLGLLVAIWDSLWLRW